MLQRGRAFFEGGSAAGRVHGGSSLGVWQQASTPFLRPDLSIFPLGACSLLKGARKADHETQLHVFNRAVCECEMSKDMQIGKKKFCDPPAEKPWQFLTIEAYWWELPRIWCRGEALKDLWCKTEGKYWVLNESIVNGAVNCVVCTSLYNFSSSSSRFIASGRRSNGVKPDFV